jgi:molybdopterin-guanine dinucleotide biosynthesis protein A
VPVVDGRPQPLHAIYASGAAGPLRALFDAGERSPTAALARLGALHVQPAVWRAADHDGRFARGLNRPDDLARLR